MDEPYAANIDDALAACALGAVRAWPPAFQGWGLRYDLGRKLGSQAAGKAVSRTGVRRPPAVRGARFAIGGDV